MLPFKLVSGGDLDGRERSQEGFQHSFQKECRSQLGLDSFVVEYTFLHSLMDVYPLDICILSLDMSI